MLTHPGLLWAASDPDLTSIVKRGKFLHDDVMCQDALPPPIDLTSPMALNVIACKSPDGATMLSTCDSEVLQSDARMMYAPCKTCHAQIDPYARAVQSFGPIGNYRTVDEAGRPIDPTVTFPAGTPLASQTVTGQRGVRSGAGRRRHRPRLRRPEDRELRHRQHASHVQHVRAQRHSRAGAGGRHDQVAVPPGGAGQLPARAHRR